MKIRTASNYSTRELETWDHLKSLFPDGEANELNWCFVGTSGVHGSYTKLDRWPEVDTFTVLVVQPRTVAMFYGNLTCRDAEDVRYLRQLVNTTLAAINETQSTNAGPHGVDNDAE